MSARWTARDLQRWRLLVKAVRRAVAGRQRRGAYLQTDVSDVNYAAGRAFKSVFPTAEASEIATLDAFLKLARAFVRVANERDGLAAALERGARSATQILDMAESPPTPPPAAAAALGRARLPYADD